MFYLWQVWVWKREGKKKFLVKAGMSSIRYNATRLQLIQLLVPGQDNETRARNAEGSVHHSFWKPLLDQYTQWHCSTGKWLHQMVTKTQQSVKNTVFKWKTFFLMLFKTGNNVHMLSGTHERQCLIMSPAAAAAKMSFSISAAFLSDSFHCCILINCLASAVKRIKKK